MNTQPKRAPSHLELVPRDEIAAAVEAIRAKIAPHLAQIDRLGIDRHRADPNGFPMPRGRIQRFDGFGEDDMSVLRYKTIRLGRPVMLHMPTEYMTDECEANFADTVEIAEQREDERGPAMVE